MVAQFLKSAHLADGAAFTTLAGFFGRLMDGFHAGEAALTGLASIQRVSWSASSEAIAMPGCWIGMGGLAANGG